MDLAQDAYGAARRSVRTPRATEYEAFARVTAQLRAARGTGPECAAGMARAVHDNRLLWTTLATDLAAPGNAFPEALRAAMLGLAGFAIRHGTSVLRGEADAETLIDINTTVMRGLDDAARPR